MQYTSFFVSIINIILDIIEKRIGNASVRGYFFIKIKQVKRLENNTIENGSVKGSFL